MKSISERMKEALEIRGMKQSELVEITGIGKSSISTYLSGAYEPKQRNIYKIAKALDVNETWLMGYDVPMERKDLYDNSKSESAFVTEDMASYNSIQDRLLSEFNKLNTQGQNEAVNRVTELTYIPQYTDSKVLSIQPKKYEPTEDDIRSLVARNGKKLTREEAIDIISTLFSDDDEDNE